MDTRPTAKRNTSRESFPSFSASSLNAAVEMTSTNLLRQTTEKEAVTRKNEDEKRKLHHLTEAAIAGHPDARFNLGHTEWENGQYNRAAKHWIIAAKLGNDDSLEHVKDLYKAGCVSKEDFAAALRGHQAAIEATKSPQREEAVAFVEWRKAERQREAF